MALIPISGDLLLRTYEEADHQSLFAVVDTSRRHLGPWLDWVAATTQPAHSLEFIQQSRRWLQEQQALALGLFYEGRPIGGIGMHNWDHNTRRAHLGYWISKDFEGRGYITAGMQAFITYLFRTVGLSKVEIHYAAANKRSAAVAARLGFRIEGVIRQATVRNGGIEDLVITGLLRAEWNAGQ